MELKAWLLGPALRAGLIQFRRLRWPKQWGVAFEDVEVKVTIDGVESMGRSTTGSFDTSFVVAAAEALERHFVKLIGEGDAGGIAVHSTPDQAAQNASRERAEREVFLALFLTRTPPQEVVSVSFLGNDPHRVLAEKLQGEGVEWVFAHLGSTPVGEIGISAAFGHAAKNPFGVVIGLGVGKTLSSALIKALEESFANVVGLVSGELQIQPLEYDAAVPPKPLNGDDRFRWGLSQTCAEYVNTWLRSHLPPSHSRLALENEEVRIEFVNASEAWNPHSTNAPPPPLFFARASAPEGITLRGVNGARSPLLEKRIELLLGARIPLLNLVPFPPPIG